MVSKNDYTIRAVDRALGVLDLFIEKGDSLTLKEISEYSNQPMPTVLRLLRTLQNRGYVYVDEDTKKYSLGYHIYMLGIHVKQIEEIHRLCIPFMEKLMNKIGLVCHVAILNGDKVIIIEKLFPENKPRYELQSRVGLTVPVHCTSVGKVLISEMSDDRIKSLYADKLDRFTDNTITDIDELITVIHRVRQQGFASTHNEHESFVRCVAYPVFNSQQKIVCAISVTGIDRELEGDQLDLCHKLLRSTARELSGLFK